MTSIINQTRKLILHTRNVMAQYFKTQVANANGCFDSDTSATDSGTETEDSTVPFGLQARIEKIRSITRRALGNCETDTVLNETTQSLQKETLGLMRKVNSLRQTGFICGLVVDEVLAGIESEMDDWDGGVGGNGDGEHNGNHQISIKAPLTRADIIRMAPRERMLSMFEQKSKEFGEKVVDEDLKIERPYRKLQQEIKLGVQDFEKQKKSKLLSKSKEKSASEEEDEDPFRLASKIYARKGDVDYGEESP